MSHNQSKADTRESSQHRRGGRSGSFNQHRGGRGTGGGGGGGPTGAAPPPLSSTPNLTSNRSFNKKYNHNAQGGGQQPRVSGATSAGSDSHQNGAHQQQPLRGASHVPLTSANASVPNATAKPTDAFQKGLMPSPQTPAQIMHKADRKYEIGKVTDEEQAKQRQLKGILNKLTPQNFEKLFQQVKDVNIDNIITLNGLISQIFDKALMEPTFCEMYANFCSHLATELPDLSIDNEKITFKRLLLNKCQEEFERGEREEQEANVTNEEGEVTMSAEEREEKRVKARRRMLGNIRLIGELYKKRMLIERIMHECIKKLLGEYQNPDEENVEALCILMSVIGEMIDHAKAKVHMDAYFDMMENMSNNMKLSSRVRFMLRDSIDLRKNKWQQKRKVEGPKKIEDCSYSSKRKCFCGEYALHLTAWTRANAGRRFYKCCKPYNISCGYWEWDDKPVPDRAMIVIKSLKTSLDEARLEKSKFNKKMEEMKAFNLSQLMKKGKLEEKVLKMKIIIMVSWALFIGFAFASIVGR